MLYGQSFYGILVLVAWGDIFGVESFNVDCLSDGSCVHVTFNWGSVSIWWEGVEV